MMLFILILINIFLILVFIFFDVLIVRKKLIIFISTYLLFYCVTICYFFFILTFCNLESVNIIFNFYFFTTSFFISINLLFLLFFNLIIISLLLYFFFYYFNLDVVISGIDFKFLTYIMSFNLFLILSIFLNNMLSFYILMWCIQICFFKIVLIWKKKNINLRWYQSIFLLFGDFFIIIALLIIYYYYQDFNFTNLKDLVYSELTNSMPNISVDIFNYDTENYLISVVSFILSFGIFFKSLYIFYWGYYIGDNFRFNLVSTVVLIYHAYIVIISTVIFLLKCEFLFFYFSIYRLYATILLGVEFNNIFEDSWVYLIIFYWVFRIFFILKKFFINK